MAAGMGSRYGGMKQIDPVGPNGQVIMDYSLYDARRAGFETVVFVIKHEIEDTFKAAIGDRLSKVINVKYAYQQLDDLPELRELLQRALVDEPPFSVREGKFIREGYSEEVDRLRNVMDHGADMLADLEARTKEQTGIKNMKVSYNKVFGYYIDVPKSAGDVKIPDNYIRKQTLVSNERYFTPELKLSLIHI